MRPLALLLLSTSTVTALSVPTFLKPYLQIPLLNHPPTDKMSSDAPASRTSGLYISDIFPRTQKINIFAGLTRDIDPISDRLESPSQHSTILAPLNSAIQAMKTKPWEDEAEMEAFGTSSEAYGLGDGEKRADANLRNFVERHIIPESPWNAGDKVETLAGTKIWWEEKDGEKVIMPAGIKVAEVAGRADNGEIWILEGVLKK